MVANGLALLGLTFAFPPYFGPGASTDPTTLLQSSARLQSPLSAERGRMGGGGGERETQGQEGGPSGEASSAAAPENLRILLDAQTDSQDYHYIV